MSCFRRALVVQPRSTTIHHHLAMALGELGLLDEASACLRHVARLAPEQPLWRLHAAQMCPSVFSSSAQMDAYWESLVGEIAAISRVGFPLDFAEFADVAPPPPFGLQFFERGLRELKESYAAIFHARLNAAYRSRWVSAWPGPPRRPRVGLVVTEGHVGIFLKSLRGVLERLSGFDMLVFCSRRDAPRVQPIARPELQIAPLPIRFDRMAQTIDEARCDLLYYWEVGTDAANYFLPFLRLAPIQVTSWGIQVTTGIPHMDYYLSSELVEPPDAASHYCERLVLASTLLTYRERTASAAALGRGALPLPPEARWYVCAQQFGKIHVDFDDMLAGILRLDLGGVVAIAGDKYPANVARLQRRFRERVPDVAHRIHILPRLDPVRYYSLLGHAQVLLDPPHFGGVNSTYDALSLGKAVVTVPSGYHRGRYTLGCYRKMGIDDCVAGDPADYAARAVRLANDDLYRRDMEQHIFSASESLFADLGAVREHERMFHELLSRRD